MRKLLILAAMAAASGCGGSELGSTGPGGEEPSVSMRTDPDDGGEVQADALRSDPDDGGEVQVKAGGGSSVTTNFESATGVLTVSGDDGDNTIEIGLNADGTILVNGRRARHQRADVTVAMVTHIRVFGLGGDDRLGLDDSAGTLPAAILDGGAGNDTLTFAASDADELVEVTANNQDVRLTRDLGNVAIDGARFEEIEIASKGGEDSVNVFDLAATGVAQVVIDLADGAGPGAAAADRVLVFGTDGDDDLVGVSAGGTPTLLGLSATIAVEGAGAEDSLQVNAGQGNDVVDASAIGDLALVLNGEWGDDALAGGDGNDVVTPGPGMDVVRLGAGDDTLLWYAGGSNDVIEGGDGQDGIALDTSNVDDAVDLSASGERLRLTRDIGSVVLDAGGIEWVALRTLGGADDISVHDLAGTGVTAVTIDLTSVYGEADGALDSVTIDGTAGNDSIVVSGAVEVSGLSAAVSVSGADATDALLLMAMEGDDVLDASSMGAVLALTLDGGAGGDVLHGSGGDDVLLGGDGDDVLLGLGGLDVLDGGAGNDVLVQD